MKKSYHSSADPIAAASMTWRSVLGDTARAVWLMGFLPVRRSGAVVLWISRRQAAPPACHWLDLGAMSLRLPCQSMTLSPRAGFRRWSPAARPEAAAYALAPPPSGVSPPVVPPAGGC